MEKQSKTNFYKKVVFKSLWAVFDSYFAYFLFQDKTLALFKENKCLNNLNRIVFFTLYQILPRRKKKANNETKKIQLITSLITRHKL